MTLYTVLVQDGLDITVVETYANRNVAEARWQQLATEHHTHPRDLSIWPERPDTLRRMSDEETLSVELHETTLIA